MVVIKGTHVFQNGVSKEYSDLDVMQMLGRAVSFLSFGCFTQAHVTQVGLNLVRGVEQKL